MHSVAIFFGFLIGIFGLDCCLLVMTCMWLCRGNAARDTAPGSRWPGPVFLLATLPVPVLLAVGGGAALWWGFMGA
jgi:hypothetical protein